jgi:hypothetical protein
MNVYHQGGHNIVWNLDSLTEDEAGNGIIFSPVNDGPERIMGLDTEIRSRSLFDPQFYVPASARGKLPEYPFFPATAMPEFTTADFERVCWDIATQCVVWQVDARFSCVVIPTRYFSDLPSDYFTHISTCYIEPFIAAVNKIGFHGPVLLTAIIKSRQIIDEEQRNEVLNWLTSYQGIHGIYLIFENNMLQKQIKDPIYLSECMKFIRILKNNGLSVHIGYNNTEGLLYSIAGSDSICMGSYENLRKFDPDRFADQEALGIRQPNPRLYSGLLLQWIEFNYIRAIQQLYPAWEGLFENSRYTPLDFRPKANWNLRQPDLYKHFFLIFSHQISALPENLQERTKYLQEAIQRARAEFAAIDRAGIFLDQNSDGSHLEAWLTAINLFGQG